MNVGVLDYENKHLRFAVSTGIGFDAAVCHRNGHTAQSFSEPSETWETYLSRCCTS